MRQRFRTPATYRPRDADIVLAHSAKALEIGDLEAGRRLEQANEPSKLK
ncbi:MAG: hypothetical protein ABSB35_39310 [Bryobacteraceae bacterium]|jgi:hypothetical protein